MKRLDWITDEQWDDLLILRKTISERRISSGDDTNGFFTQNEVMRTAHILFGKTDIEGCHKAELYLQGALT